MAAKQYGKYEVTRELGRGGMATVYAAQHPTLGRAVAIKVISTHLADDPSAIERFLREANLIATLRHPHIIQLYDFDLADGQPYMVMEHLDGGTLRDRLQRERVDGKVMDPAEVARMLDPIASALDYAHARGVVHRDIKPSNILFTAAGDLVLTDFGLAKMLNDLNQITRSGGFIGTPNYMSPEQAIGEPADRRSDIYSLTITAYEMLAGRVPFEDESAAAVLLKHVSAAPPPLRQFAPEISPGVEAVIARALAKEPDERYASAGEFARTFREAVSAAPTLAAGSEGARVLAMAGAPTDSDQGAGAPATSGDGGRRLSTPRPRWPVAVLALLLFLAVSVPAGFFWLRPHLLPAHEAAAQAAAGDARRLVFRDGSGTGRLDQVGLAGPVLPGLPADRRYELWLLGGDQNRRDLGPLSTSGDAFLSAYDDPGRGNLLTSFDGAEITVEPAERSSPLPSTQVVLHGVLPPGALMHIRHLLVPGSDGSNPGGYAVGVVRLAQVLEHQGQQLKVAADANDLRGMTSVAEGLANLIEGRGGKNYGDINGDGIIDDPGDGYGLLPAGERPGYVEAMLDHARLAAGSPDATANVKLHAWHVEVCATNIGAWTTRLQQLALEIARARDPRAVATQVNQAVALTKLVLNGQDVNGNEQIEPIPGEGGALTALEHAQFMADMELTAP